ncbi:chemotaxis protein CheA [Natrialba swarupiae]|uniref:Chemotaxis protein CheA n=1 Tax=Natrialba swarupiae TaxID=2448032 RepID=A0A5D5AU13_9EURY|nr:chemotaxis protein CheA [Natrialba swarupiae]TYT63060.1 chemotaxis protein CheA [Natrialba swarupiae]
MTEYWTEFVQESHERITQLNNALLTLERNPDDEDAIENIFRIAHTLKGNCGAAGLESASDLAHGIEDLLDAVRAGDIDVTAELMDDVFDAVDQLETMVDEVDADGEIETDPSATIRTLRDHLETSVTTSVDAPSDEEVPSILSRFDPPADENHDAYLARIAIDEAGVDEGPTNGSLVVDALIDAFDLIGTVPSADRIDDGTYGGQFDAVFGCAVGEQAIVSGLESVEEVTAFGIREVTVEFETASREDGDLDLPTEAGMLAEDVDRADISSDEARDLGVDELLDEFDEFDDLDEKIKEVEADEDLDVFDEMGEAGSFDDLFDQADEQAEDESSGASDPTTRDETSAADATSAADTSSDEEVEDAESVFAELKEEVDTVGFDELQDELDELEFDEFDDEEEVSMDELLGDELEEDDDALDETLEEDLGDDGALDEPVDVETAESPSEPSTKAADEWTVRDDSVSADSTVQDDPLETDPADDGPVDDEPAGETLVEADIDSSDHDESEESEEPTDLKESEEPADLEESDESDTSVEDELADEEFTDVQDTYDPEPVDTTVSFDDEEETTHSPIDSPDDSVGYIEDDAFEDVGSGFGDDAEFGDESVSDIEDGGFGEPADEFSSVDDDFGEIEDDGFGDSTVSSASVDDEFDESATADSGGSTDSNEPADEAVDPLDLVDDTEDSFEETFGEDAFDEVDDTEFGVGIDDEFHPAEDSSKSTEQTDESEDGTDEEVPRIVDEPSLEIPDITVPDTSEDPDRDRDDDAIQSVRIDVDQIDELMTLVEGLVTSRVRLRHEVESDRDFQAIEAELDDLEGLTTELQETVMDVRLIPLETVVNRLPRIVRDIAREQDKEVAFEIRGEDVELDRSILDRIRDPLIHLVRNAVDHGIEPPDEREAAGKPREGSVELTASRSRNRVTITVSDDGSGLDPDRLRSEAIEAGVLSAEEANELKDEQTARLIFQSGLSTASEVTDVSGRGVGMDVVKRTIEDMEGTVSIDSKPGDGTTVTMTLPVSIAIDDVLFVQSGDEEFGIPTEAVHDIETANQIETTGDERVFPVGDEMYPVIDLEERLETPGSHANGDGVAVRIRDSVRPVVLHCDDVYGQQEVVVKPFEGFMSDVPGLSGATVRGRGKVVNIIDVTTL